MIYLHMMTLKYSYLACICAVCSRLLCLSPDHECLHVQKHLKLSMSINELGIFSVKPVPS